MKIAGLGALVTVGLGLGLLGGAPGLAQVTLPTDFTIPKAENSPGEVTFSHARHLPKVGKCTLCHMRDLKMKRGGSGPLTMEAMQQGKRCGFCHDGKTMMGGAVVFPIDQCDSCHRN